MQPIGSIYMSVSSTNPNKLFGGTWEKWGSGRVPVCIDTNQTEFNTVEKTGGSKTHTLTTAQMPSHTHNINVEKANSNLTLAAITGNTPTKQQSFADVITTTSYKDIYSNSYWSIKDNGHRHEASIGKTGGGGGHNNLQPYITCYMWKRIA